MRKIESTAMLLTSLGLALLCFGCGGEELDRAATEVDQVSTLNRAQTGISANIVKKCHNKSGTADRAGEWESVGIAGTLFRPTKSQCKTWCTGTCKQQFDRFSTTKEQHPYAILVRYKYCYCKR